MKKSNNAFTLVELMIVIVLIGIIFLMFGNMNFHYMGDRQKAEQFTNKIISEIETVRNNALIGRGVLETAEGITALKIPETWTISIGTSETITTNDISSESFNEIIYSTPKAHITKICGQEDPETITFKGKNATLTDTTNCTDNKMIIETKFHEHKYKITFDAVTGLATKELVKN